MPADPSVVDTLSSNGHVAKIYYDDDLISPRHLFDYAGTMVCWHSRYDLGDTNPWSTPNDFLRWANHTPVIKLPLYLYDHSGLAIATQPFSSTWDSMPVGWIFITQQDAEREMGHEMSPDDIDAIKCRLQAEVMGYNQYLAGDVYTIAIFERTPCDCCHTDLLKISDRVTGVYGLTHALDVASHYLASLSNNGNGTEGAD